MKIGINGASTMKADLPTDLATAAAAGYDLVEIWGEKLDRFLRENRPEDLRARLDRAGLGGLAINSIENITFRSREEFHAIRERCEFLSAVAAATGTPYVVVVPSPLPPKASESTIEIDTARVLRDLAILAGRHGVGLAFEFIGRSDCSVPDLARAIRIVEAADRENVGLVLDAFHFHAGGSRMADIARIPAGKLFVFHVNDAEDRPRSELTDAHRLYPGEGVIPLVEILRALAASGYDGAISIELFRPEYWERDPGRVAREAKERLAQVLAKV